MTTATFGTAPFGTAPFVTAGSGSSAPRLRMTARGRRVLLAAVTLPLVAVAVAVAINGGQASASNEGVALTYVSVEQGQSLWQLAEQIAPNADPRSVIAEIVSLNRLDSAQVDAGQSLAIPSEYVND